MNTIFIIIFFILVIIIMTALFIVLYNIEKNNKIATITTIQNLLEAKSFVSGEIYFINKHLSIAINKAKTKLAIIENFNPKNPTYYTYDEIMLSFLEKIELNTILKLSYLKKGEVKTINIYPVTNIVKNFIRETFKLAHTKKIDSKFPQIDFSDYAASSWNCDYIWGYSDKNSALAYFQTGAKQVLNKINLKQEFFTIDTKYKYFEAPIFGIAQQLLIFEKDFLNILLDSMLKTIKHNYSCIVENSIYFDSFKNVIYLTNGQTSLQSILINDIYEVYYKDNRITFELKNSEKMINFMSNQQQIADFENFMTNLNLSKIIKNYDKKIDKLINATQNTKFIIDFSKDRIVYSANLNKFNSFSYIIIPFMDLKDAQVNKSGTKHFVRITTINNQTIDSTCDKKEIAQYIKATLDKIINGEEV